MTVTVNLYTEQQEKALIDFLDSMHYDYQSSEDEVDIALTDTQKQEVLKRDADFINGKTTARNWDDINDELSRVYR